MKKKRLFKASFASCSLSHTGLLNRAGLGEPSPARTMCCLPLPILTLHGSLETQGHPAASPLSHLHLQIGTHGVQKTHRPHLHPLPPLHHPTDKWIRSYTAKGNWVPNFSACRILTSSLWERLSPGSSSSHSSSLSTS